MDHLASYGQLWGRWDLVMVSIAVHLIFLFFFISSSIAKPKKTDFRSKGILVGFIVALYFEMYGIPLTIFLLQPLLPNPLGDLYPIPLPVRILGSVLIFAGFIIMYLGWKKIFHAKDRVVKEGIYAHIRHPQYVGLALFTFGQLIQWPTITGFILWPILIYIYYKLSLIEERDMEEAFGNEYLRYKGEVPRYIPRRKSLKSESI